jgi:hypothetical protein
MGPAEGTALRGVCVVTVERQVSAASLITVSVLLDVSKPYEETRGHFTAERETLEEVRRFLRAMTNPQ